MPTDGYSGLTCNGPHEANTKQQQSGNENSYFTLIFVNILFMELYCVNSCVNYTCGYQKDATANPVKTSQWAVLTYKWDQSCWRVAQTCLEVAIIVSKSLDKPEMQDTCQSTHMKQMIQNWKILFTVLVKKMSLASSPGENWYCFLLLWEPPFGKKKSLFSEGQGKCSVILVICHMETVVQVFHVPLAFSCVSQPDIIYPFCFSAHPLFSDNFTG